MFEYLNAGKHGATLDLACHGDRAIACELIAQADILVEALEPGTLDGRGLDIETLRDNNSRLVVVRISNFGQHGPSRNRDATPLTMQAASGWISARDPDRPPVQAGARISEYVGGRLWRARWADGVKGRSSDVVEVDVSVLEALLSTLPYPMLFAERMRSLGLPSNTLAGPMLGIVRAADGWIGINCLTGQHWLDVCAMLELAEYGEHQISIMLGGPERAEFFAKAERWLAQRTVAEIVELSQALRIPASPVNDGATTLDCPQYVRRAFFVEAATDGWSFRRPHAPFRLSKTPVPPPPPAPALGAHCRLQECRPGWVDSELSDGVGNPKLPFAGLKVLDLSTFWAGAYLTCYLGAFGADIVKVESIQRPDGHRYSGVFAADRDDWYERSPLWQGTNLNKRDLTLDLTSERAANWRDGSPPTQTSSWRTSRREWLSSSGWTINRLCRLKPDVIFVRMPGFGLDGPWRDYVGWALNIEQTAGMSAVTGYADGPPCNVQGPADPIVGVHAGVALLAALEHRRRTGEGQLIEIAQIEVGACVTAEPVIEYSMNGVVRPREGNRQRGYVQGVYRRAQTTRGWRSRCATTSIGRGWWTRWGALICSKIPDTHRASSENGPMMHSTS